LLDVSAPATQDIRQMLAARRGSVSDPRSVPVWFIPDRYATYGEFCAARQAGAMFPQSDMGFAWRHNRDERGHHLMWLPSTGELLLIGPRPDNGSEADATVEVVAHGLLSEADIRRALPRWAHAHNTFRDPLAWLRRTLAKNGFTYAQAAPDAA
jgi:hypothetical protein